MSTSAINPLDERTVGREVGEFVVGAGFSGHVAGFALGDGTMRVVAGDRADGEWRTIAVHDGPILSMSTSGATAGDGG